MLFFARLVVWVGNFLPEYSKFTYYFCLTFSHDKCKQKVIAWHKAELEKMDPFFRMQQDGLRLVAARDKALAEGISPLDPRYPGRPFSQLKFRTARNIERRAREEVK